MDKTDFGKLWTVLTSAYPTFQTPAATIEVYYRALADLPAEIVEAAILDAVSKSKFFPTIAEIRDAAARLALGTMTQPPALEAWGRVKDAVALFGRDGWARAEEYLGQPAAMAIYALSWRGFCDSETDEEMSWRARFVELYEQYQRRELDQARMLPAVREMAAAQLETRRAMAELTKRLTAPGVDNG